MSNKPLHWQDNLVFETVDQINKDLQELGAKPIVIPSVKEAYEHLLQELSAILQKTEPKKTQSFMYRVDIPESAFRALNQQKQGKNAYFLALSAMIIEREFKKVYLKHYFKQQGHRLE